MRHGWLAIPGVQTGDRELDEQTVALLPAIAEAKGKTVLDLGCAEGLIGREFARAGASKVTGIDSVPGHLAVASLQCRKLPMDFILADLNNPSQFVFQVDIVLCLGLAHKLTDPAVAIRFAADCSRDLVLIRSGRGADENGFIKSKFGEGRCDSHGIMRQRGFDLERVVVGPPPESEPVEYWKRVS